MCFIPFLYLTYRCSHTPICWHAYTTPQHTTLFLSSFLAGHEGAYSNTSHVSAVWVSVCVLVSAHVCAIFTHPGGPSPHGAPSTRQIRLEEKCHVFTAPISFYGCLFSVFIVSTAMSAPHRHGECPFSLRSSSNTNIGILSVAKHKGIRVTHNRFADRQPLLL